MQICPWIASLPPWMLPSVHFHSLLPHILSLQIMHISCCSHFEIKHISCCSHAPDEHVGGSIITFCEQAAFRYKCCAPACHAPLQLNRNIQIFMMAHTGDDAGSNYCILAQLLTRGHMPMPSDVCNMSPCHTIHANASFAPRVPGANGVNGMG